MPDTLCSKCSKAVGDNCRAIQCENCLGCHHLKCSLLTIKNYNYYSSTNDLWLCICYRSQIFPFHSLSKTDIYKLSFNSNCNCLCSKSIACSRLDSLPCLDILSSISNTPHLTELDVDLHLPSQTNFKYYTTHDFYMSEEIRNSLIKKSFSAFHCNIRSLAANYESLVTLLHYLVHTFSVIGVSETKVKMDLGQIINTEILGYHFISQPTLTNAGGVGFYIQDTIHHTKRDDLSITEQEHETLWIEIDNKHQRNIICGLIYTP